MVCNYKIFAPIAASIFFILAACSDDSSNALAPTSIVESSSSTVSSLSSSTHFPSSSSPPIEDPSSSSRMDSVGSSSLQNDKPSSSSSTLSPSSSSTPIEDLSSGSQYFWNDEFDGDEIDNSKWTYDIGTGSSGWGNNEWEYYTDRKENAYIKDGILHIRAQKEDYKGSKYTSARMLTKGKFAFKYGTVEARIALPTGKGIWPAFWMLGENFDTVGWPACGEIDIIEAVNSENIVYGTNHWANGTEYATYGNNTGNYRDQKHEIDITQFHTYKFTWDEKYIRMFVDDFMYHEILIENSTGDTEEFHKPFFFILNVAVAGNWPGFEVDDTQFPNEMLVDYIRVYK
ncbi:MAG: glycoside hydrolase family 16 protein [Fibrobacter sp.]|nr:glycoside hydrolase family 16 protein [Fibrobacter sp.]